ncbi:MAG TPA: hypothetical protein VM734_05595, partial [Kofleriaceae bacterium]|nr:hypothetical protein [Kofleriaceae bacterium]
MSACVEPETESGTEYQELSCPGTTWAAGTPYRVGDVVRYPANGQYYLAVHENPGYDPTISTWFWEPTSCSGGNSSGGTCSNRTWAAGTAYRIGDVVRYPANGQYYIAEHDNPGYDPIISTWFWDPYTCPGGGGGGTGVR